jgi:NADPH:quinone reductase
VEATNTLGATPIEGRTAPLDAGARAVLPAGVDTAFDGVGGPQSGRCVAATKRGGVTVWYGFVGLSGLPDVLGSALRVFVDTRLRSRRGAFYGITQRYCQDPRLFRKDLPKLFELLASGKIQIRATHALPPLAARTASEPPEAGAIEGNLVLVAPAL